VQLLTWWTWLHTWRIISISRYRCSWGWRRRFTWWCSTRTGAWLYLFSSSGNFAWLHIQSNGSLNIWYLDCLNPDRTCEQNK
jgi:hypothetical protein